MSGIATSSVEEKGSKKEPKSSLSPFSFYHKPVLLDEVVDSLNCSPGKSFVDCTVGTGGHAEVILEKVGKGGKLIGIDCDKTTIGIVKERLRKFGDRFIPVHGNFRDIEDILRALNVESVDGVLFDLGFSSRQLDDAARGFSFMNDGPLDMRMDMSQNVTAAKLVNQLPEQELVELLQNYGEERKARRIAKFIVENRRRKSIKTTKELADIVMRAIRFRGRIHPATRTFQALRIAVNKELEILQSVLEKAVSFLCIGGRICVISYHSLEDRIVKREFLRLGAGGGLKVVTKKPVVPSREEQVLNRRCRSAKMRVGERVS